MNASVSSKAFDTAYQQLNKQQKLAVDTIEGPVMVIAGPGTGKTQILTLRIANILRQTDTLPESILALTFTESGAKAMRERLVQYIGSAAYQVTITTFHAFAGGLIGQYPDAYPAVVGGQAATDLDRIRIIEAILEGGEVDTLRPGGNPQYYVRPLLGVISDLKRENISPDRLAELIAEQEAGLSDIEQFHTKGAHKGKERGEYKDALKHIEKNRALNVVYRAYEAALRAERLYDFDDMIVETVRALESDEDILRDLQEQYQYLLADEHQDVNGAQNRILELLASYHDQPNIFVVGDEKQAIFRFQGASLENFLYFEDHFTDTVAISLTENYRSGQAVLDTAHDLIAVDDGPLVDLRVPLTAAAVDQAIVSERKFAHQAVEDYWVVEQVQAEIKAGTPASEIAVIVRSNREVEELATTLRAAGVPVTASAESDILNHPVTRQIESLLRAVGLVSERAVFEQLHAPYWQLAAVDVLRVCAAVRSDQSLVSVLTSRSILESLELQDVEQVYRVGSILGEAAERAVVEPPHIVLAWLLEASGYKQLLLRSAPHDAARIVRRLYDEIEGLVRRENKLTISDVLASLAARRDYGLPLNAPFVSTEVEAVQVMTAHKSKGLEFEVVFAPHLIDSVWGGKVKRQLFKIPRTQPIAADEGDDEKRLLYVLMTRAKRTLYLSFSEQNADGRPLTISRLLAGIKDELVVWVETDDLASDFHPLATVQASPAVPVIDTAAAAQLFTERGFSATSLNNYLQSPYTYYFRNLLRIPEPQTIPLLYGTAVHDVLRQVVQETQSGKPVNDNTVIVWLEQSLRRLPISETEYTRLHQKGLETVLPYAALLTTALPARSETERSFSVLFDTGNADLPLIPLKGNLDRLDFDESDQVVRIVDYKTGKTKSRNAIEGNTATSDGGYKRQLVFYALLLELYGDERYQCRTGVLSFVESAGSGSLKEEEFEITDDEIDTLKTEITNAAEALLQGTWVAEGCDAASCEYCYLVTD